MKITYEKESINENTSNKFFDLINNNLTKLIFIQGAKFVVF